MAFNISGHFRITILWHWFLYFSYFHCRRWLQATPHFGLPVSWKMMHFLSLHISLDFLYCYRWFSASRIFIKLSQSVYCCFTKPFSFFIFICRHAITTSPRPDFGLWCAYTLFIIWSCVFPDTFHAGHNALITAIFSPIRKWLPPACFRFRPKVTTPILWYIFSLLFAVESYIYHLAYFRRQQLHASCRHDYDITSLHTRRHYHKGFHDSSRLLWY